MTTRAPIRIRSGASDNHMCLPHMLFRYKVILKVCHMLENEAEFASEGVNSYRTAESGAWRGTGMLWSSPTSSKVP